MKNKVALFLFLNILVDTQPYNYSKLTMHNSGGQ